jgi:hypothetical protein
VNEESIDMDAKTDPKVLDRLEAACDTKADAAPTYRQRLARASRSGLAERLESCGGI